jgi:hypothetical protein
MTGLDEAAEGPDAAVAVEQDVAATDTADTGVVVDARLSEASVKIPVTEQMPLMTVGVFTIRTTGPTKTRCT